MTKEINIHQANEDYRRNGKITLVDGDKFAKENKGCLPAILIGLSPALIYLLNQLANQI